MSIAAGLERRTQMAQTGPQRNADASRRHSKPLSAGREGLWVVCGALCAFCGPSAPSAFAVHDAEMMPRVRTRCSVTTAASIVTPAMSAMGWA